MNSPMDAGGDDNGSGQAGRAVAPHAHQDGVYVDLVNHDPVEAIRVSFRWWRLNLPEPR